MFVVSASEQVAQQYAAAAINKKIWGNIFFNVKAYDAKGNGTDDAAPIQKAVDAAISGGSKFVFFPPGTYYAAALNNLDQVTLVGDNATLTVGNAKLKIDQIGLVSPLVKSAALYNRAIEESFIPHASLRQAKKAVNSSATLKVAFWGDSITEGADQTDPNDAYTKRVESALRTALPGITVTVGNFGLGGRSLAQAVDTNYKALASEPANPASGFYRSWSVVGKSWRDHIKDFTPDLLIVAFGMNDAGPVGSDLAEYNNLLTLINYAKTWSVVPSIVLVSTFLPTKDTSRTGQGQNVTNSVARATRMSALLNKVAVADANRLFQILRDGIDDLTTTSSQEKSFSGFPSKWTGDTVSYTVTNGVMAPKAGVTSKYVYRNRQFFSGIIDVGITPQGSEVGWIVYRKDAVLGQFTVLVRPGAGAGAIELYTSDSGSALATATGLNIPAGSVSQIKIVAVNNLHTIYLNGTQVLQFTSNRKLHNGTVGFGGDTTPPTYSNLTIIYDDPLQSVPVFTEDELIGVYNDPASGNGINHPTGLGHALFYLPAFNGIIRELSSEEEKGLLLPLKLLSSGWLVPGGSLPTVTNAGENLYYRFVSGNYDKSKGIALRRDDNFTYYGLSSIAVNESTVANLEPGKFAYYKFDSALGDIIFVSVPAAGTVTWNTELYRFASQP